MIFELIATWIMLSFDDGISKNTKQVWDMLAEHNIQARFYVIWNTLHEPENKEIAKRLVSQWHKVCNHTYSHKNLDKVSIREMVYEIAKWSVAIKEAIWFYPDCFRPPYWAVNRYVRYVSYRMWMRIDWSLEKWVFDTMDWDKTVDPVERMKKHLTKNHTEILMHDNQDVVIKEVEYIIKNIFRK